MGQDCTTDNCGKNHAEALKSGLRHINKSICIAEHGGEYALNCDKDSKTVAMAPAFAVEQLGSVSFCRDHHLRYPYIAGAMASGISSVELVATMAEAGMLGFFGAGGLPLGATEKAIIQLQERLGDNYPYGFNLLSSPSDPSLEKNTVDLYIKYGVHLVEASAYLRISESLLRFRLHGMYRTDDGTVMTPNKVIAKVSRQELAKHFFQPPPERLVRKLLKAGVINPDQAEMAKEIPVAQDLTCEADSGGHTDKRPAITLLPAVQRLARQIQAREGYQQPLRVGLAGGISTPASAAAAFAMGADYILTGSVNQACVESGTSDAVRAMLAKAKQSDVMMAPSAIHFEVGGQVQVLKRGNMFAMRANKLRRFYETYDRLEDIPQEERTTLETTLFRTHLEEVWEQTRSFFAERDPEQLEKAEKNPKYLMALVFRAYLGMSSRWAVRGEADREDDYQIWCGPSMGAFNEWVAGTFLEAPKNRGADIIALNILHGAAMTLRLQTLRSQGVELPSDLLEMAPLDREALLPYLA